MYEKKEKTYFIIALWFWIMNLVVFFIMGILYKKNVPHYNALYYALFAAGIGIALCKDRSIKNLGLTGEKIKSSLVIAGIIIAMAFLTSIFVSGLPVNRLLRGAVYYLFYIALVEEVLYRGLIQSYLFGLDEDISIIFVIGALMFAFMHVPFQMYVNNEVSFTYLFTAFPQLVFTFCFHMVMCFITYKRKDIMIPIALHFAVDYIQAVL